MSKRQRRRVNKRRTIHMEQVKHRAGLVPRLSIAVAAVAVPAIAPPAAQAAPRAHHFEGSALRAVGFDVLKAPTGRAHRAHRLSDASFTGLAVTGAAAAPAPAPASRTHVSRRRRRHRRGAPSRRTSPGSSRPERADPQHNLTHHGTD